LQTIVKHRLTEKFIELLS